MACCYRKRINDAGDDRVDFIYFFLLQQHVSKCFISFPEQKLTNSDHALLVKKHAFKKKNQFIVTFNVVEHPCNMLVPVITYVMQLKS